MKRLLLSLACVMSLTLGLAGAASAQGYGVYYGSGGYGYPGGYAVRPYYSGGFGYSPRVYAGYRPYYAPPAPVYGYPTYYQGYRGPNTFNRRW